eukprot:gnl/TRDRNA2_/TRDRNA2_145030_c1_seq2.p4 gnl/TRDRNA2_/TRDRNA2_145030_c1~~gnl/TRDRNA2_/TRDRNA2_145030_c1_seq2.p4  ORF type:complete len:101 (+),score=8.00 gnl/TRDRNA2_/TRDRNA2_145030_c1_seq2:223-525(+)
MHERTCEDEQTCYQLADRPEIKAEWKISLAWLHGSKGLCRGRQPGCVVALTASRASYTPPASRPQTPALRPGLSKCLCVTVPERCPPASFSMLKSPSSMV